MREVISMKRNAIHNEQGAVLVVSLMMLVILSIMGAFAMTISMIEQKVTLNSEVFQHNFYSVEGTTLEAAAKIDNTSDTILLNSGAFPAWLRAQNPAINMRFSNQWPSALIAPAGTTLNGVPTNLTPPAYAPDGTSAGDRIWNAAIDNGICAGGSLTDPTKEEHCYDVYGMYDIKRGAGKAYTGRMMMTVGYKKVLYY